MFFKKFLYMDFL